VRLGRGRAGFHRPDRQAELLGDLANRQVGAVTEGQDLAVAKRQLTQAGLDGDPVSAGIIGADRLAATRVQATKQGEVSAGAP
jgi:hypothetical protein